MISVICYNNLVVKLYYKALVGIKLVFFNILSF